MPFYTYLIDAVFLRMILKESKHVEVYVVSVNYVLEKCAFFSLYQISIKCEQTSTVNVEQVIL
jgi:hypothetical protein